MSIPVEDLMTALMLPPDLRAERWLIVGAEPNDFVAALAQRGAALTFAQWDELASFRDARFAVVVCHRLFAGVRHPLLALENVCTLTTTYALLYAPLSLLDDARALLCWDESMDGWQANRTALARMARSAGFARVAEVAQASACDRSVDFSPRGDEMTRGLKSTLRPPTEVRATWLQAFRHWPASVESLTPSLTIRHVFNPVTGLSVFPRSGRRAFVAVVVTGLPATAQRWEVRVRVGGFGVAPIYVGRCQLAGHDDCVQVNAPLPPRLPVGLVEVQLSHQRECAAAHEIEISEGSVW